MLNTLLASLAKIPWQVMILGGEISQGTMLKVCRGWCTRGTAARYALIW
ncbi:hypothetical protein ECZU34_37570 [Escherichia coli]|nr:hypothetical protein ECZU34_37570 [Escherichia coli]